MNERKSVAIEITLIFSFIMVLVWTLPGDPKNWTLGHWILVTLGLVFVLGSWRYRKDNLKMVGLLPDDFNQARPIFIWVMASLSVLIGMAFIINPVFWEQPNFGQKVSDQLKNYLAWAVFQQLILHGYFTNRLQIIFKKPWLTAMIAGLLFALVHLPNPVLAIGALIFGGAGAYFFLKSRNLYILALAHAILGTAVKYLVANQLLDHAMRVGPGFWK